MLQTLLSPQFEILINVSDEYILSFVSFDADESREKKENLKHFDLIFRFYFFSYCSEVPSILK